MKTLVYSTTALSAVLVSGHAFAQESTSTQQTSGLKEIIVTAQKRSENLQSVPIAITAASGEQLEAIGINNTLQLNVLTPGLTINETAGSFQPSIRGIGTASTVAENPVALYIDGVYIPQQRDGVRELEDVEQISVLKGPQGTLFGRNATAGVIQITTRQPEFDFGGKFRAELDNYETLRLGGYVTGGLSDTVAMSLSANYATQGRGWGDNLTTGRDTYKIEHDFSIRGKLLFEVGDRTDIVLSGDYADNKRRTAHLIPLPGTQLATFITPNPYVTDPITSVYDTYGLESYNAFKGGGASLTINHESDAIKLVSITAYRDVTSDYAFDAIPVGSLLQSSSSPDSPSRSFSQEFQVISNDGGPLQWMFGLYYFNYENGADPIIRNYDGLISLLRGETQSTTTAIEHTESVAPFGEFKWEFLPDTRLTGGIRYTYERRELKDVLVVSNRLAGGTTTNTAGDGESIHFSEPTFRIGLDHSFSPDLMVYAQFNTGFKSGGFNSVTPNTAPYEPEKLKAYSLGFKSELLDRRLRFNAEAFYYDYTNLQVIQFVNSIQSVTNGPKAELYGIDVDFQAQVTDGLGLSGGFSLMHSEFTDYDGAIIGVIGPGGVGASLSEGDATGNRLPQAKNFSGTLAVDYHHDLADGGLDFNVTANYNGDYYFQADNAIRQPAYTIINASASWTLPGENVTLKVWGKNLADEKVATAAIETPVGFLSVYTTPPLTFGGTAIFKF